MPGIYSLKGTVKHYDWGGVSFIPSLLKIDNREKKPFAEYWMGTHPFGDSLVNTGGNELTPLSHIANAFPFLLKILDVKDMLSIQVHPSKAGAEEGFAKENTKGVPLDAPNRNYKDDNHKPELMVALSDFWLLHGFKPTEELIYTLLNVVELRELLPIFNHSGYSGLYKHVMMISQEEVNRILQPLLDNLAVANKESEPDRFDEDYWVAKAAASFNKNGNIDRGIFSIYLFNLVHLKKGEGIFQLTGVPHAYLEGQNVEIMANSDNVLRGGLTTKHIDVPELLKHTKCEATYPSILSGEEIGTHEKLFKTSAPDFQLSVIDLAAGDTISFTPITTEILLLTEGMAELDDDNIEVRLGQGNPAAVAFTGQVVYLAAATRSTIFRASVPHLL
ncbi:MAG: mannose-6-phosphate isomerase, class I [Chitinophagaceae bacterium]|jgi:mannose-6-phosphate isomerase|nr:mannose-6-phosphate isomerase, class I [Chitinophagaceae bacterium]MBK7680310.1 mannose-6-phosphate isomerase, class I [Chitinophagaceae bacterium]MBK8301742.1 mannose-6-phosphate isomerase, class I [Chitinophagaceae bacterium]MBK9466300.1 mannose-6-phosphate isomerase, class I [Chitinophagaceae bacterium]MBK9661192.1 mannose-6-phosphate isomerase, class I [Chitinophagaceae bacterium]